MEVKKEELFTWKGTIKNLILDAYSGFLAHIAKYVPEYKIKDRKIKEQGILLEGKERDLALAREKASKLERDLEQARTERTQLNLEKEAMDIELTKAKESYEQQLAVYQREIETRAEELSQLKLDNVRLVSEIAGLKAMTRSDREGASGWVLRYLDSCYTIRLAGNKGELRDCEAVKGQLEAARQEIINNPQKYTGWGINLRGIKVLSLDVAQEIALYAKVLNLDRKPIRLSGVDSKIYRTLRKAGFERDDMVG